jgi:DNA-binding YbaB/EbfC family protein
MGSGFAKKKKQARALQEQMMQMQEAITKAEAEGSAGNGLVTVKINGSNEMLSIKIKPECVDPEDIEGLEDLICAACNDAQKKLQESSSSMMPGMPNIPGLGGFPF